VLPAESPKTHFLIDAAVGRGSFGTVVVATGDIYIEAIGLGATGLILAGFMFRAPRTTMKFGAAGLCLWLIHFAALGAWAAGAGALVALWRNVVGIYFSDQALRWAAIPSIALLVGTWMFSPEGAIALLALGGAFLRVVAVFFRERLYLFRGLFLAGEAIMIPYAVAIGSTALMINSSVAIVIMSATLLKLWREDRSSRARAST